MSELLMTLHLQTFVPLRIEEIKRQGGPTDDDIARVKAFVPSLCEDGDALLYRRDGVTGPMAGRLVDALAVLAFGYAAGETSAR